MQRRTADYQPPRSWRTWLIGRPLQTADSEHESIGKFVGLAVFASDALSSTAYATQEILFILAGAGAAAFIYAYPIAIAIVILLAIVTVSYEQIIHAYPGGGGAYIVARDNLGELPAQVAGASLLTDYILTVAVSISAGVAQVTSAFPAMYDYRVEIAVGLVLFMMVVNLRGVRESGSAFAIPSYFFLVMMSLTVGIGLVKYALGTLGVVSDPPHLDVETFQAISLFLILHAFASGTTALTGVEAISNGITAFRVPRSRNAGITLIWMSSILAVLFLGITFLSVQVGAVPSEHETVISQLARTVFDGRNAIYLAVVGATMVILIMAANTSFNGFPRLSALLGQDGFLPRQLAFRGSRLVYSRGIVALALVACVLIIAFQASVTALIPLYAIGVFLCFTLSQGGMARRWRKSGQLQIGQEVVERGSTLRYERRWRIKMLINGFGAFCTTVVTLIFAVTKFRDGAPVVIRHRVILAVGGVHQGTLAALRYARALSDDVTAVHVSLDPEEAERIQARWDWWGKGTRLVILDSPYRLMIEPLLAYIEEISKQRQPNETITIVVPQFVPKGWWANLLHAQTATWLRFALLGRPGIVVTDVPYQVE
ncbi:MAG: APC family permease [Anaerolineae bacterium]|nr:APC family permease [Anaerolineae bacterium]